MKIGILTLPFHTNYGGILQAYALQTVLEQLGHQAELMQRGLTPGMLPWHKDNTLEEILLMQQHTDSFIRQYIHGHKTSIADTHEGDYEAIVVGSDQIWRYLMVTHMMGAYEDAFLSFANGWDLRRISYAPSFGLDTWEAPETMIPVISNLLRQFHAVSVREQSGADICRQLLGVEARHVLDPTLLLQPADYDRLIQAADTHTPEGNLMCYVLDETPEKLRLIQAVARRYNLQPFRAHSRVEQADAPLHERIQPRPEQWLRSIRDAAMVVTDSFHAVAFSILYGKPFIATGNPMRGLARLQSLLSTFHAEDHLVVSPAQLNPHASYAVDPTAADILNDARHHSLQFLNDALK